MNQPCLIGCSHSLTAGRSEMVGLSSVNRDTNHRTPVGSPGTRIQTFRRCLDLFRVSVPRCCSPQVQTGFSTVRYQRFEQDVDLRSVSDEPGVFLPQQVYLLPLHSFLRVFSSLVSRHDEHWGTWHCHPRTFPSRNANVTGKNCSHLP